MTAAQAAGDLEINVNVLRNWVREHRAGPMHAFPGNGLQKPEDAEYEASGATYGAPRVRQDLRAEGLPADTKRIARLMRENRLVARRPGRRRVVTTDSNHTEPIAPNLLERQLDVHGVAVNTTSVAGYHVYPNARGGLSLAARAGSRGAASAGRWTTQWRCRSSAARCAWHASRGGRPPA